MTVNGEVRFTRAYYYCASCQRGYCPFDYANDLDRRRLSPGLRPLVVVAGTVLPFGKAAHDLLQRMAGVTVSASTARRVTEEVGAQVQTHLANGPVILPFPPEPAWDFRLRDGDDKPLADTVGYLGLDAFSVPQQASGGGRAASRMLYLGVLYTPDKKQQRYVAGWDMAAVAARLRQEAIAWGYDEADEVVALTDAGGGIENCLQQAFWEDLPCVLDWYHAMQHVGTCAQALYPQQEKERQQWYQEAEGVLWEKGGSGLWTWLEKQAEPTTEASREGLRELRVYVSNQKHRMAYPDYRAKGWDIGSGPVEAGCKVVGSRLKGTGMRWLEAEAGQVGVLRALYAGGRKVWDGLWHLRQFQRAG